MVLFWQRGRRPIALVCSAALVVAGVIGFQHGATMLIDSDNRAFVNAAEAQSSCSCEGGRLGIADLHTPFEERDPSGNFVRPLQWSGATGTHVPVSFVIKYCNQFNVDCAVFGGALNSNGLPTFNNLNPPKDACDGAPLLEVVSVSNQEAPGFGTGGCPELDGVSSDAPCHFDTDWELSFARKIVHLGEIKCFRSIKFLPHPTADSILAQKKIGDCGGPDTWTMHLNPATITLFEQDLNDICFPIWMRSLN